jgi:hypothetical protein
MRSDDPRRYGFFVNVFVRADDAESARREALEQLLARRADLREQLGSAESTASIGVIETVEWDQAIPGGQGLVWYDESSATS